MDVLLELAFTPSGAAIKHINLMLFAPRFLSELIASTAEPPVATLDLR